jgi:DNA-binding NarL/FixJ family response regulator
MTAPISILLADDHTLIRQGVRALLEAQPDIKVLGDAEDGRQAVTMARELRPDVIVMDIAMPQLSGLEATRQILRDNPAAKILILSSYGDEEYVHQLTDAGACGYLIKQTAATDLIKAIHEAHKGNAFFSPTISRRLLDYYRGAIVKGRPLRRQVEQLTSREQEVLQLVAEGHGNKQIAAALFLSIKTIEKHRQNLMNKLNIHEIAGLTRYAIAHGIVEDSPRLAQACARLEGEAEKSEPAPSPSPARPPAPNGAPEARPALS